MMKSTQILNEMRESIDELEDQLKMMEIDGVGHLPREDTEGGEGQYTHMVVVSKTTKESSRPSAEQHTRQIQASLRDDAAFSSYDIVGTRTIKEDTGRDDEQGQ